MYARILAAILVALTFSACEKKEQSKFNLEKRYWDVKDYEDALSHLRFLAVMEKGLPRLSDPESAAVFQKLVDKENVSVVLEDPELGLEHKNEQSRKFFDVARELYKVYYLRDSQDKFIYPVEFVSVIEFNLHTQILYFKAGNSAILKDAIDPEATSISELIRENEQIIVNNFNNYIDLLTKEDGLDNDARRKYAEMIDTYYSRLIDEFPKANYNKMKDYALKLGPKIQSPEIKSSLDRLIDKINSLNAS